MTDLDDGDLRALIDTSFGDGPEHRPLEATIGAGRRAVRRRATSVISAVLAVLMVGGGTAWLTGQGATTGLDPLPPASEAPSTTRSTTPTPTPAPVRVRIVELGENDVARIAAPGVLEVDPEATVLETLDDPYGLDAPAWSVALAYELRGETRYLLITTFADEPVHGMPLGRRPGFEDWVQRAVARMPPDFGVERAGGRR